MVGSRDKGSRVKGKRRRLAEISSTQSRKGAGVPEKNEQSR